MFRLFLLLASGVAMLSAQTPMGGPSLGTIFDPPGQALRPILGIPGAASFGDPILPDSAITAAGVSLKGNLAVLNDGAWKTVALSGAAAGTVAPLPDGLPLSAKVAVSETGAAAAFYDAENDALSTVIGIGSGSVAVNPLNIDALPGPVTALAIADDGSLLLSASLGEGDGASQGEALFWIASDGSTRQLASLQATASILLWNHGASALVTDRTANRIWNIQDPGGNAALTMLASDADGVSGPAGAALSADGSQLWIANAGNNAVIRIDTSTRAAISLPCSFPVTTLIPLADGASFRLNELDSGPVWLLDSPSGVDPRLVFIPAVQRPVEAEGDAQ